MNTPEHIRLLGKEYSLIDCTDMRKVDGAKAIRARYGRYTEGDKIEIVEVFQPIVEESSVTVVAPRKQRDMLAKLRGFWKLEAGGV